MSENYLPNWSNHDLDAAQWAYEAEGNSFEMKKIQEDLSNQKIPLIKMGDGKDVYLQGPASHDGAAPANTPYMNPGTGFQSYFLTNQADAKASTPCSIGLLAIR